MLPSLITLDLQHGYNFTDTGLQHLGALPRLRDLNLANYQDHPRSDDEDEGVEGAGVASVSYFTDRGLAALVTCAKRHRRHRNKDCHRTPGRERMKGFAAGSDEGSAPGCEKAAAAGPPFALEHLSVVGSKGCLVNGGLGPNLCYLASNGVCVYWEQGDGSETD